MKNRVQPPHIVLLAMLVMVVLHYALPLAVVLSLPWNMIGVIPVVFGLALNQAALRALKQVGTTTHTRGMPSALVTEGVFRLSRHPIYLGMLCVLTGSALILGTLSPLLVVPAFAWAVERLFIAHEEQRLSKRFGQAWAGYASEVRRWV